MKKILLGFSTALIALTLAGCGHSNNSSTENTSHSGNTTTAQKAASKSQSTSQKSSQTTFKNGVLKTENATLEITKTQLAHDDEDNEDGLIIYYSVTNTSSDQNIKPETLLNTLSFHQKDNNSSFSLETDEFDVADALYPNNDDSAEKDNFEDHVEDAAEADVLPGKTVDTVTGLQLKNKTEAVVAQLSSDTSQNYTIKLK